MIPTKDPAETITITFDFSDVAASVSGPVVECLSADGADVSAAGMKSGSPTTTGAQVLHLFTGGLAGATYSARCTADIPGGGREVREITFQVAPL